MHCDQPVQIFRGHGHRILCSVAHGSGCFSHWRTWHLGEQAGSGGREGGRVWLPSRSTPLDSRTHALTHNEYLTISEASARQQRHPRLSSLTSLRVTAGPSRRHWTTKRTPISALACSNAQECGNISHYWSTSVEDGLRSLGTEIAQCSPAETRQRVYERHSP